MRYINFRGIAPKLSAPRADTYAEVAENVRLSRRTLLPLTGPGTTPHTVVSPTGAALTPGDCLTLHRSDGVFFGWPRHVHIAPDPQNICGPESFLFADQGKLWRTSGSRVLCGLAPYPVGICAPTGAMTATILPGQGCTQSMPTLECVPGEPAGCDVRPGSGWEDADVPEARVYVFTYLTEDGQESAPSPLSEVVDVHAGEGVVLMPADTPPAHAVARRWYRAVAGTDGQAVFLFVKEQPIATAIMLDDVCPLALGHVLDTWSHYPPECVEGVSAAGDLMTVIWAGKDMWLSEPKLPHAYLPKNRKTVRFEIVTCVESQGTPLEAAAHYQLVVLTQGLHYICAGATPDKFEIRELAYEHPAVSARAVCVAEGGVVFACPTGLAVIKGNALDLLIDEVITRREWPAFRPERMSIVFHRGELLTFSPDGGICLPYQPYANEQPNDLTTHTVPATACWTAPGQPLYLCNKTSLNEWGAGQPLRLRWRSTPAVQSGRWHPASFKVVSDWPRRPTGWQDVGREYAQWRAQNCDVSDDHFFVARPDLRGHAGWLLGAAPVHLTVLRDGRVWFQRPVEDSGVKRTPRANKALQWAVEVSATVEVQEIHLQSSPTDLTQEGGHA
jgi:hypothetical protein